MMNDDKPRPFNVGGDKDDDIGERVRKAFEEIEPPPMDTVLVAALTRLLFEGGTESIRLELFTGEEMLSSRILRVRQVVADKRIEPGDNNAVFTLSRAGRDALMTALANGQTLIVRVTRGAG